MFADAGTSVSSRFSVRSSNHSRRSRKRFPAAPLLSSFLFWFLVFRLSRGFPNACCEHRHFVNLLDSLNLMNSAATMQKTSLRWNLKTIQGQQQARRFPSCMQLSSHLWSDVAFDHWSTHRCIRPSRRAYLMTGRQASPRVTALS